MKTQLTDKILMGLFALCIATILATTQCGCRSLAPGGVYQGDKFLAQTEATITTSYTVVNTFLTWENDNRPWLATWPGITDAADKLRDDFPNWYRTANVMRDVYVAHPGDESAANLEKSIALLRAALVEATTYMTQVTAPNPPTP